MELLTKIVERLLNGEAIIELANFFADQDDMAKAINRYEQAEKIEAFEREALSPLTRVRNSEYKKACPYRRPTDSVRHEFRGHTDRVKERPVSS